MSESGPAHEVSILITGGVGVGRCAGSQPRAKVSMMSMRPPQHGQGRGCYGKNSGERTCVGRALMIVVDLPPYPGLEID